jgi:hypothetical protein
MLLWWRRLLMILVWRILLAEHLFNDQRLSEQMLSKQQNNIDVKFNSSSFHSRAKLDVTCYCCQKGATMLVIAQSHWITLTIFIYSQQLCQKKRTLCQNLNADTTKSKSKDQAQHCDWRDHCHKGWLSLRHLTFKYWCWIKCD